MINKMWVVTKTKFDPQAFEERQQLLDKTTKEFAQLREIVENLEADTDCLGIMHPAYIEARTKMLELQEFANPQIGDLVRCFATNTTFIWNGTKWIGPYI